MLIIKPVSSKIILNSNFKKLFYNSKNTIIIQRFFSSDQSKETSNEKQNEQQQDDKGENQKRAGFQKFKEQYKKPAFLKDDYDHLVKDKNHATIENTGFDIGDDEFLPDYFALDAPSYKRNTTAINLPWLISGAPEIDIQTRFVGEQIFSRMKVHKNQCLDHLFKIYRAILLASQDRDFDFLEEYCEEMFFVKLRNRLNQLKSQQIELIVEEDLYANRGKPMQIEANMYDHVVIKGLSPIRRENGSEDDYYISNEILGMGHISYIPKYITDPNNFADKSVEKHIHDDAHKLIFRAYVNFKTGYKIYLKDKYGKNIIEYPNDYSWRHVGVFETEMERPKQFKKWGGSENLIEWMAKHQFGVWKLVDLDNWLVGNPLVIPKFQAKQESVLGSQGTGFKPVASDITSQIKKDVK